MINFVIHIYPLLKMKLFRHILCIAVIITALTSCTITKESYLKKFDNFVENVKDKSQNYNEEDWTKAEKTFKELSGPDYKKFESELTPQEKLKIAKLIGQYRGIQLKFGLKFLKENIEDAINGASDLINEIQK